MITFAQAIAEVGEWSEKNFGDQKGAGALASCLGIGEELGEFETADVVFFQAVESIEADPPITDFGSPEWAKYEHEFDAKQDECEALKTDALCDALVYLADLCYRSGVVITAPWPATARDAMDLSEYTGLNSAYGRVAHVTLKRRQGIRGFHDDVFFVQEFEKAATELFIVLCSFFGANQSPADEFFKVWTKVSKRDWVANPVGAGQEVLL